MQLRDVLARRNETTVDALLLATSQNRETDGLVCMMVDLVKIQLDPEIKNCTMLSTREKFDVFLSRHAEMAGHLNADARIVHSSEFERSVVLIQAGKESALSISEAASVACMRKTSEVDSDGGAYYIADVSRPP